jgi:O2-independent ubiquinone biosynthesis accessory factor UbiT
MSLHTPVLLEVVALLAGPLRLVPHALQREALELALESVFRADVAAGELDFLEHRCLAVEIEDTGWRWPITVAGARLRVLERSHPADVVVRGRSPAFLCLAARLEDPDTLFFQRRLVIEGDTELGLRVKNLLDALDEERLALPLRLVLEGVRRVHGHGSRFV